MHELGEKLIEMAEGIVCRTAESVLKRLPPCFEIDDLKQAARLAVLKAAPGVDHYLKERIRGAMIDSIRGRHYQDATHEPLWGGSDIKSGAQSPLDLMIENEAHEAVRAAVELLPTAQAELITGHFSEHRRRGRPRRAEVDAGLASLRRTLKEAA